jgi:hypothetical protein
MKALEQPARKLSDEKLFHTWVWLVAIGTDSSAERLHTALQ